MSLLLDALKRAEQEKLARHEHEPARVEDVAVKPVVAPAPPRGRRLELEAVAHPAPDAPSVAGDREREGVKAVFAAKHPEPTPAASPAGGGRAVAAIAISALILLVAGGAYVWYEIGGAPSPMVRAPLSRPAPNPIAQPPAPTLPAGTPAQASPASRDTGPPTASPGAAPAPDVVAAAPAKPGPRARTAEPLVASLLRDAANAEGSGLPLRLSPTVDAPRVPPDVVHGYDALKRGDVAAARKHYEAAVSADPASLDGHLGLATAAARAGDRATAARHYRRALELDPRNPSAVAGITAMVDFSRPEGIEAQLRADITRNPGSPALHYTLGSLYASQSRWNEAQAAYFEAYRLDPDNADLAYNLAVSLDHLGQAKLAADFYRRALAVAGPQDAQFDKGRVARRVAELNP